MQPPIALSIAGFDPSNGAGVTADLQVFAAHRLFGTSVITGLTVQNTRGVSATQPVSADLILETLESLWNDLPPSGIKIGMLATSENVQAINRFLEQKQKGTGGKSNIPIVLDPVIASTSGASLLDREGVAYLREEFMKRVTWITPNWNELSILTGTAIGTSTDLNRALDILAKKHPHLHIVVTGGDREPVEDTLHLPDGTRHAFTSARIESTSTHGTGCAFSSALLGNLLQQRSPIQAVASSKSFVEGAIRQAPGLGQGHGPLNLLWPLSTPARP